MDIWLSLYALTFLFAIPKLKWHRRPKLVAEIVLGDPTETRYFRSDQHTINGLTAYKLLTSQSGTSGYLVKQKITSTGYAVYYYFRVWKRTSGGSETLITDWVLHSSRGSDGEGLISYDWNCPTTNLNTTDSIVVDLKMNVGGDDSLIYRWTTEQLGANVLSASTWTIWLYTHRYSGTTPSNYTTGRIWYDTTTYNSRILNFKWGLAPAAPTNCSVSILSETSLRVSWTDASANEDDFHVERKISGGSYTEVQIVTSTTKTGTGTVYTWDDSGLLVKTTYYYRVRAHQHTDDIYSSYSNEAYNTTPFYAPTTLAAISLNIDAILVQWVDNSQVESDYHIERHLPGESFSERDTAPANSTTYIDQGLDPAIVYTYRVRAHHHGQNVYSDYSNEASEAPKLLAQIPFNPFTPLLGYY